MNIREIGKGKMKEMVRKIEYKIIKEYRSNREERNTYAGNRFSLVEMFSNGIFIP